MFSTKPYHAWLPILLVCLAVAANAQSFRVQCPTTTVTHPTASNVEPPYTGATTFSTSSGGFLTPSAHVNGAIKCQQISGGDGFATMGDGTQTYMFSFGPLSGLADIAAGKPGTQFPNVFNTVYSGAPFQPGDPATTVLNGGAFTYNGAIGLVPNLDANNGTGTTGAPVDGHVDPRPIMDVAVLNGNIPAPLMAIDEDDEFFLTLTNVGQVMRPDLFEQHTVHFHGYPNASGFYDGVPTLRSRSTSAAALRTTTLRLMLARTSGIATSRRLSICRWAWSDRFMCVRARIAFRWVTASMRLFSSNRLTYAPSVTRPIFSAPTRCPLRMR